MDIKARVERVERLTEETRPEDRIQVILRGQPIPDGPTIEVVSEEARQLTERILDGERTGSNQNQEVRHG